MVWFSQYTFKHLPKFGKLTDKLPKDIVLLNIKNFFKTHKDNGGYAHVVKENILFYKEITKESFRELFRAGNKLFTTPNLKYFLISFFFYSVGMQTIFLMATLFGKSEINLSQEKLILTLIVIQIEAIIGAIFFSWLSRKIGNKNVISIAVILWMVACLSAYYLNKENPNVEYQFYGVAGIVGLVMGGLQAMSVLHLVSYCHKTVWRIQLISAFMMYWKSSNHIRYFYICYTYRKVQQYEICSSFDDNLLWNWVNIYPFLKLKQRNKKIIKIK